VPDQAQVGALAAADCAARYAPGIAAPLVVDDFLRIIEAAAALRLAAEPGVGGVNRGGAGARGLPDLILGDSVTAAQEHARDYNANATYSQLART
jgi:hypothetical protein